MFTANIIQVAVEAVARAHEHLLGRIATGRDTEEPAMTSALVSSLELGANDRLNQHGVRLGLRVLDSAGRDASEHRLGPDICGVIELEPVRGMTITKGFFAQAKRTGRDGLSLRPPDSDPDRYGHWLYRGSVQLEASGIVSVTRPSALLVDECYRMLRITPDSFVWVYHPRQVGVVSASSVLAAAGRPEKRPRPVQLGTKSLEDFFIHYLDCFIGDPRINAYDTPSLLTLLREYEARFGVLIRLGHVEARMWDDRPPSESDIR